MLFILVVLDENKMAKFIPMIIKVKGMDIKWAWRSANINVKNGNSVISCPGGSGGIIRLLLQKSNAMSLDPA
tara:strand:+ start:571 stop:786 length:216 start_codon:yes stop_codon:yes gene_type:complete